MLCPKCGHDCDRDEVDIGVGMMYGPYGCSCGWSENPKYDYSEGKSPAQIQHAPLFVDSKGGLYPTSGPRAGECDCVADYWRADVVDYQKTMDLLTRITNCLAGMAPHVRVRATAQLLAEARDEITRLSSVVTEEDVTVDDVEAVEDEVGMGRAAWDCVDPKDLIVTCVNVMRERMK
jgi:hypothetical protein